MSTRRFSLEKTLALNYRLTNAGINKSDAAGKKEFDEIEIMDAKFTLINEVKQFERLYRDVEIHNGTMYLKYATIETVFVARH